ncbi:MAG: hypothetical protein ACRDZ9_09165 [Acidimicrobiales bacterium]
MTTTASPPAATAAPRRSDVHRAFSVSILVSAVRCLLTYVVLPFAAPAVGVATGVGPWIGIPLSGVAVAANVVSIRRFWLVGHRWRWAYTAVGCGVIALLVVLVVGDVADLVR